MKYCIVGMISKQVNVVILKGRHEPGFFEKWPTLFSRGRMDTRVGAFESSLSQLSQEFLFVFIAPLETFLHHLEVGGNPFFGHIK